MIPRDEFSTIVAGTVEAQEFTLVDSNGNVRFRFGPKTLGGESGYALVYDEPTWANVNTEAGMMSAGRVLGGEDVANTQIYAQTTGPRIARVSVAAIDAAAARGTSAAIEATSTIPADNASIIVQSLLGDSAVTTSSKRVSIFCTTGNMEIETPRMYLIRAGVVSQLAPVWVASGTSVQVTDANQQITIAYGVTFNGAPMVCAINGDRTAAAFYCAVNGKGAASITIRCEGAGVGVNVRVDWIAVGLLA